VDVVNGWIKVTVTWSWTKNLKCGAADIKTRLHNFISYYYTSRKNIIVQAFISCRLDYCNSLCVVLKTTCCSVCNRRKMQQLGLLYRCPASWPHHSCSQTTSLATGETARVNLKLAAVYVNWTPNNTTVQYLVEDCQLVSDAGRRRLRFVDLDTCIVPQTRTHLGDRRFPVLEQFTDGVAPTTRWNRTV